MERKDYLKQFEQEVYIPETDRWIQNILKIILEKDNHIIQRMKQAISDFMKDIAKMQKISPIEVGQISLSVMRTAIWENKPKIRIDAYDVNKELGANIAYQYENMEFFSAPWKEYEDALVQGVKKLGYDRYVRNAQIEQYMSTSINRFINTLIMAWKYEFIDFDELDGFDDILKSEVFIFTIGEYLDNQKIMFATVPVKDIVADAEEDAVFQRIEKAIYRKKEWKNTNWTRARFKACEFSKCSFSNINMNDVRFVDCLFRDDCFEGGTLYGAKFTNCRFLSVDMKDMKTTWKPFENGNQATTDIYREVEYINCLDNEEPMDKKGGAAWNTL